MITVLGGIKGGSGKTTLSTNICVIQSFLGKKVLLVDADEQQSASCLLYTSPSPRDVEESRMPSSA